MCGIFGNVGKVRDAYRFHILGLYNDTRGGDSCGVLIKKKKSPTAVHYGHDKTKLYKKFLESKEAKAIDFTWDDFALGHCRKASVGAIGLQQAQPVTITDDNGEIVFAMIHNGTLLNYKELANKYEVPFLASETDSQIFAKIVYKVGYHVLSEYNGAGAFVFYEHNNGDSLIKVFKGASRDYKNGHDKTLVVERPLFFMNDKGGFWFSSIEESLQCINKHNVEVYSLKQNTLFILKDGNVIDSIEYSRANNYQTEFEVYTNARTYYDGYGGYWDGIEDARRSTYSTEWNKNKALGAGTTTNKNTGVASSGILTKYAYGIVNEIHYRTDGFYYVNNKRCNGRYDATKTGYINTNTVHYAMSEPYWFINGILMKSYFHFLAAEFYLQDYRQSSDGDEMLDIYLAPFSVDPVPYEDPVTKDTVFYGVDYQSGKLEPTDDSFTPSFMTEAVEYDCNAGIITSHTQYKYSPTYKRPAKYVEFDSKILAGSIPEDQLEEMIIDLIIKIEEDAYSNNGEIKNFTITQQ